MNTGLFRFFRFECWAWRQLATSEYIKEERLYHKEVGPLRFFEERPAHGVAIAEAHLCIGPVGVLLGRSILS